MDDQSHLDIYWLSSILRTIFLDVCVLMSPLVWLLSRLKGSW